MWEWLKKPFEQLGEMLSNTIKFLFEHVFHQIIEVTGTTDRMVNRLETLLFSKSLKPEMFKTPEIQQFIRQRKADSHNPAGDIITWLDGFLLPFIGKSAPEVMLETAGIPLAAMPEGAKGLIDLMNLQADLSILTGFIDIIADVSHHAHIKHIGRFIDRVMASSGVGQLQGYGLGTALGTAISPMITYAINYDQTPLIPAPSDLIMFLVKEVYMGVDGKSLEDISAEVQGETDPDAWVKYDTWRAKQLVPYPPEFYFEYMKKHGFNRLFAEDYWAQHWEEPSVTQATEMFSRLAPDILEATWRDYTDVLPEGIAKTKENVLKYVAFDMNDLKRLLRFRDVNPYWRSKVAGITFRPYTRVDIRRMYEMGSFKETITDVDAKVTERSKIDPQFNQVYLSFRELEFAKEKAYRMADFYVAWATDDIRSGQESLVVKEYAKGWLPRETALDMLEGVTRRPELASFLLDMADADPPMALPSKTELKRWLKKGWRDENTTRQYLDWKGYSRADIELYLREWTMEED